MSTKIHIRSTPTSLLIYYRLYRDESPFTKEQIDKELKNRPYISFESPKKVFDISINDYLKSEKGLTPRFIKVKDEEAKISMRGPSLSKYAFSNEDDIFTHMRIILTSGILANYSSEVINPYTMHTVLTWSERVLWYSVAKRMAMILSQRQKFLAQKQNRIWLDTSIPSNAHDINKIARDLTAEKELLSYLKSYITFFKKGCILDDMDKLPLNYEARTEIMTPIVFHRHLSRIIPSGYYETIWDRLLLNGAIHKEQHLMLPTRDNRLMKSIDSLEENDTLIADIKKYVQKPLGKKR